MAQLAGVTTGTGAASFSDRDAGCEERWVRREGLGREGERAR